MPTLSSKNEIFKLIRTPEFQTAMSLTTREEYLEQSPKFPNELFEYFTNKWSEDEEGQGVKLFSTPKRGNNCGENYGTWLTVSKLYDNPELPFRVEAAEYVPWGVDVDFADVGDFKTLGEALDVAFTIHEVGRIELNVIREDEVTGRYIKDESIIAGASASGSALSQQAQRVNQTVQGMADRRQAYEAARKLRYASPACIADMPNLLSQIQAKMKANNVEDEQNIRLHLAAAIKTYLFSGSGELIEVVNNYLKYSPVEIYGTTLLLVKHGDEVAYIDGNGVYGSLEEANESVAKELTALYEPQLTAIPGGKPHSYSVSWYDEKPSVLRLDENTFLPVTEDPELMSEDPMNPYPSGEEEVNRIVNDVAHAYKMSRERRFLQTHEQASTEFGI